MTPGTLHGTTKGSLLSITERIVTTVTAHRFVSLYGRASESTCVIYLETRRDDFIWIVERGRGGGRRDVNKRESRILSLLYANQWIPSKEYDCDFHRLTLFISFSDRSPFSGALLFSLLLGLIFHSLRCTMVATPTSHAFWSICMLVFGQYMPHLLHRCHFWPYLLSAALVFPSSMRVLVTYF